MAAEAVGIHPNATVIGVIAPLALPGTQTYRLAIEGMTAALADQQPLQQIPHATLGLAVAGGLSGVFGGLVGNQGGIRSAALLGFNVSRDAFVGTATAVALMVDAARMPVYIITQGAEIVREWPRVLLMTAGVLAGTTAGRHLLKIIPEQAFRRIVSALILLLGFYMAYRAWEQWNGG